MAYNFSILYIYSSSRSSIGWAGLWRCLGYKFKSYLEQVYGIKSIKLKYGCIKKSLYNNLGCKVRTLPWAIICNIYYYIKGNDGIGRHE